MLKLEDMEVHVGRAVGGSYIQVIHKPTGIFRVKMPPLGDSKTIPRELMLEIEAELLEKNLTQYIQSD
jgi:hypothetical protein